MRYITQKMIDNAKCKICLDVGYYSTAGWEEAWLPCTACNKDFTPSGLELEEPNEQL